MNYFIIGPTTVDRKTNVGMHFIDNGLRWLVSQVDPEASFWPVDFRGHSWRTWEMLAERADWVVYAGNPRFNAAPEAWHYWDTELWDYVEQVMFRNVRFFDAWAGGSHNMPIKSISEMAKTCRSQPWVRRILRLESKSSLCIVRDELAEAVFAPDVPHVKRLPCCSWFAPQYHHIEPVSERRHNMIIPTENLVPNLCKWLKGYARKLTEETQLPTLIVTHNSRDAEWAAREGLDGAIVVYDPPSVLRLLSRCERLVSMRLHASIPALALGCQVWHIANDARALSLKEFGVTPHTAYACPVDTDPNFQSATVIPAAPDFLDAIKGVIE